MFNGMEDFQKSNKENMDKAMASVGTVSKGLQTIAVETADFSKKNFEDGAAHFEKLLGVKTLDSAVEMQSAFAKDSYEAAVGQATKLSELYVDFAKDLFKPFEGFVAAAKK